MQVKPREPIEYCSPIVFGSPISVSSLGVAYHVLSEVERVIEGSPAAKAGVQAWRRARGRHGVLLPTTKPSKDWISSRRSFRSILPRIRNWPVLQMSTQNLAPGTTVQLTFQRQGEEKNRKVKLNLVDAADWFNPDRGFLFELMTFNRKAKSIGEAFALGGQDTLQELTIVFRSSGGHQHQQGFAAWFGRAVGDCQDGDAEGQSGQRRTAAVPHAAERQSGHTQFPAHSRARRRTLRAVWPTRASAANRPTKQCKPCWPTSAWRSSSR